MAGVLCCLPAGHCAYVPVVEFRADEGGGIGPGQFQEFLL